ncbi:MAG: hypothetical protein LUQ44_00870, partial [Methanothrix sp.]|nr:hypothetical protein [Methanothrix sp.]
LLECPQIAGVKGHLLTGYGPEERLLLPLVIEGGLIRRGAGHEEQAQWPGRRSPGKGDSFFSDPGRRRMAKRGSSPRNSPSGGSSNSQGRFKISEASEAMTRKRVLPEGTAERIFSQEEARKSAKSWAPRAASAPASISGRQDCSKRELKLREICRSFSES